MLPDPRQRDPELLDRQRAKVQKFPVLNDECDVFPGPQSRTLLEITSDSIKAMDGSLAKASELHYREQPKAKKHSHQMTFVESRTLANNLYSEDPNLYLSI